MQKVLILSYFFPPCNLTASQRAYGWAKSLNKYGYYPVIITRSWDVNITNPSDASKKAGTELVIKKEDGYEIHYLPYKPSLRDRLHTRIRKNALLHFFQKSLTFIELLSYGVTSYFIPYNTIYTYSRNYLKTNKDIKAIVVTANPFLMFKFGYLLNKEFKIKWIADYRDDWSTSELHIQPSFLERLLILVEKRNEKKWVSTATHITSISEYYISKITKFVGVNGSVLLNGYLEEDFKLLEELPSTDFTIVYNGSLYDSQPIEEFLESIKALLNLQLTIKIKLLFIGTAYDKKQEKRIKDKAKQLGIIDCIEITERKPRKEVLKIQKSAHALIMLSHNGLKGIPSSKLYEYIGIGKPIISFPYDNDIIDETIKNYNLGTICNSKDQVIEALKLLILKFQQGEYTSLKPDKNYLNKFSRDTQTKILSEIISDYKKTYQVCSRCIMDTSDPAITFNEKGECNHCIDFIDNRMKQKYRGVESDVQFHNLIKEMKEAGKGKRYDCVLGLSGGSDSSYVAYIAKQNGLRVLAVHMDNGWNSEKAVKNIEHIAKKLQIDYESYILDWDEFKTLQVAFLKADIPEADTPTDIAILGVLHKIAAKYNVQHIISGGNFATEGILPKYWHYNAKDRKYFDSILKTFDVKNIKALPFFGYGQEIYYKLVKKTKMVYLLNYVNYSKQIVSEVLKKELDLSSFEGKHYESTYTGFIQSYYLFKKFGIDYRKATLSSQICTGEITRDEALKIIASPPYNISKIELEKEYIAKKLNLSINELEKIILAPPKWYTDYPNDEKMLTFIYNTYRKLFKKEKLGSF